MERLRQLFSARRNARARNDALRIRSNRIRYFFDVFGSQHWAERIEGRRIPARRGNVAL